MFLSSKLLVFKHHRRGPDLEYTHNADRQDDERSNSRRTSAASKK